MSELWRQHSCPHCRRQLTLNLQERLLFVLKDHVHLALVGLLADDPAVVGGAYHDIGDNVGRTLKVVVHLIQHHHRIVGDGGALLLERCLECEVHVIKVDEAVNILATAPVSHARERARERE